MSDTPVTVSEPPQPSETLAPSDTWTIRMVVISLAFIGAVGIIGVFVLAALERDIPTGIWTIVTIAPTALATLATTRGSGNVAGPGFRLRRDQGAITLMDVLIVLAIVVLVVLLADWFGWIELRGR